MKANRKRAKSTVGNSQKKTIYFIFIGKCSWYNVKKGVAYRKK